MNRNFFGGMTVVALGIVSTALMLTGHVDRAQAHCQVPCGIYDDPARIDRMHEDATTIEKAIRSIQDLAGKSDVQSVNQAIRWTVNKEAHASHIITVTAEYFLAQRVKPVAPDKEGHEEYLKKLAEHHAVIVAAMKTKQEADLETVAALRAAIDKIAPYYGGKP